MTRRSHSHEPKRLIVTADDFGRHPSINEAVETTFCHGILTSASLMVGASAVTDAVTRARRLPDLAVGLHLTLVNGWSCLAPARIPDLVDARGRFDERMARAGCWFFFSRGVRRQLAAEIEAQFEAFAATGLALDHVDTHKHFHVHPTVFDLILQIGVGYGLPAIRIPDEPAFGRHILSVAGRRKHAARALALAPLLARARRRAKTAGVCTNDYIYGLTTTGYTTPDIVCKTIDRSPPGLTELYLHPAMNNGLSASMPTYDHRGETAALLSKRTRRALDRTQVVTTTYRQAAEHDR